VRDSTQIDYNAHKTEVKRIMGDLGIDYDNDDRIFEIINKTDICPEERRDEIEREAKFKDNILPLSAVTGEGVDNMLGVIDEFLSRKFKHLTYEIPVSDGKALAWLYQHGEVIETEEGGDFTKILVHIDPANQNRFEGLFPYAANQS
jgi:GTP-binding protein HflX